MAASLCCREGCCILNKHSTCVLVGQMDSPFVRHIAIALTHHGIEFRNHGLSVFADFEQLLSTNPAGSVPALQLSDSSVIVGTAAICEWIDSYGEQASLASTDVRRVADSQTISMSHFIAQKMGEIYRLYLIAVASGDSVATKPWISRCLVQINGALNFLACNLPHLEKEQLHSHASIAVACCANFAWQTCRSLGFTLDTPDSLAQFIKTCEFSAAFRKCPPN
jgi:glutathione S-transferase